MERDNCGYAARCAAGLSFDIVRPKSVHRLRMILPQCFKVIHKGFLTPQKWLEILLNLF